MGLQQRREMVKRMVRHTPFSKFDNAAGARLTGQLMPPGGPVLQWPAHQLKDRLAGSGLLKGQHERVRIGIRLRGA